jgi:glycosyltransferase involved in cell wall biosynthesis
VLIPAYNVVDYVAEAIESVLVQTYPAVETIVVNDGSTDGTAGVIRAYREHIVYIEQENRGLAAARNAALAVASGGFIGLLDADDIWLPERLERCVAKLDDRPEIGFVTTDAWLLEDGTRTGKRFYDLPTNEFAEQVRLARMIRSNVVFPSVVARRELYDRHGKFDESLRRSEDYDLWLRFLAGGEIGACIAEPLAYYRLRSDSLSANGAAQARAHRSVLRKQLHQIAPLIGTGFGPSAWEVARECVRQEDRRAASRFFLLAARDPGLSAWSRARGLARAALASTGDLGGSGRRRFALKCGPHPVGQARERAIDH